MKQTIFTLILVITFLSGNTQNAAIHDFESFCLELYQHLAFNETGKLNEMTDAGTGIYIMYKMGPYDTYKHQDKLDESYTFSDVEEYEQIQYGAFPEYDPGEEAYAGKGIFADTTCTHTPISTIIELEKMNFEKEVPESFKNKTEQLEKNSRKILFADTGFLFYATLIRGKWYLTIIDKASNDFGG